MTNATAPYIAALGSLASQLSHDISNPLSVVRLALKDGGRDTELLAAGQQAADRIKKMIDELARLSKAVNVKPARVVLRQLVLAAVDEVRGHYPDRRVEASVPAELEVLADCEVFSRVLSALIRTSLAAAASTVTLSARATESASVELLVSDWGSPLRPEFLNPLLSFTSGISFGAIEKLNPAELELWRSALTIGAMGGALELVAPGSVAATATLRLVLRRAD